MAKMRKYPNKQSIIPHAGHLTKGKIVAAGIPLGQLAMSANISQPALSNYLKGIRNDRIMQLRIWDAFCRLSGQKITLDDFWGELLS